MPERGDALEIGKGRIVREGTAVAILSFGTRLKEVLRRGRRAGGARASRPPSPMPASPSRSTGT